MLRYLYSLALPGGRRVVVVYYPPKPETELRQPVPVRAPIPFDRSFAALGVNAGITPTTGAIPRSAIVKRTR